MKGKKGKAKGKRKVEDIRRKGREKAVRNSVKGKKKKLERKG